MGKASSRWCKSSCENPRFTVLVAGDAGSGLAPLGGKEGAGKILELAFTNFLNIFRVHSFANIQFTITVINTRFGIANATSGIDPMQKKVSRNIVFDRK